MSKRITPLKAIRAKCLECSCNQPSEVRLCPITECSLFFYRGGTNPSRKGIGRVQRPKNEAEKPISEHTEALNG